MADLKAVLKELEQERNRLDEAIRVIRGLAGGQLRSGRIGKRRLSPAARKRIAAAQKARWAKWKAQRKKAA
jgi:hypothetical protein